MAGARPGSVPIRRSTVRGRRSSTAVPWQNPNASCFTDPARSVSRIRPEPNRLPATRLHRHHAGIQRPPVLQQHELPSFSSNQPWSSPSDPRLPALPEPFRRRASQTPTTPAFQGPVRAAPSDFGGNYPFFGGPGYGYGQPYFGAARILGFGQPYFGRRPVLLRQRSALLRRRPVVLRQRSALLRMGSALFGWGQPYFGGQPWTNQATGDPNYTQVPASAWTPNCGPTGVVDIPLAA